MDLFTESESSQDAENMVCEHLLPTTHLTNDQGYTPVISTYIQAATTEILILWMSQVETLRSPKKQLTLATFSRANNDAFTLVGLDDDWETIGLQPNPPRDETVLSLTTMISAVWILIWMLLRLDFPGTRYLLGCSLFYDLGSATLDQPVLDLDSDNEEIAEEERFSIFRSCREKRSVVSNDQAQGRLVT
jgi:hypothetical protein